LADQTLKIASKKTKNRTYTSQTIAAAGKEVSQGAK